MSSPPRQMSSHGNNTDSLTPKKKKQQLTGGSHANNPTAKGLVREIQAQLASRQGLLAEQREMILAQRASNTKLYSSIMDQLSAMDKQLDAQLAHVKQQRHQHDSYSRNVDKSLRQARATEARDAKRRKPAPPISAPPATSPLVLSTVSHGMAASSPATPSSSSATPVPPKWDVHKCGQFGHLSNLHRTVTLVGDGWNVVVATHPVDAFSVRVSWPATASGAVAVGFTREPNCWKIPVNNPPRSFPYHKTGWFVNVNQGTVSSCNDDEYAKDQSSRRWTFQTGEVLTAAFDFTRDEITFANEGNDQGTIILDNVRSNALYPAVVSYDTGVQVEFVSM
ncbi:hypothetical protein H257_06819 [Aphanomyces astaci]|uniref:SPRY domain-containing protein n=1 Tax=Aphanomyces astaci TaxID=112090 RepID=W4GIP6_APHAT|nr:hypothetical protein H257_06819 [Aphanomyces astaci]ETV79555.1 hypothetical protein H257_06819 [Aphanomyces astaci]RQM21453.1 hypothetical protein B5M09_009751 [Aphanomyces astaci]|eukprot:XP_009830491.1 hypothetical protein H257_06819 [Aphanomyces astaci]